MSYLQAGDRVRLCVDVDRFPDFVARRGAVGVVVHSSEGFAVALDDPPSGSEEWDGVLHWHEETHGTAWRDEVAPDNGGNGL